MMGAPVDSPANRMRPCECLLTKAPWPNQLRDIKIPSPLVWQIDLAPLSEPKLVAQTVAVTLGVRESPGQTVVASLIGWLGQQHMLVVLDNCEHLTAGCAQLVTAMLRECPKVHVLATSRELLGVAGELVRQVSPLSTLPPAQDYADAVQLFADRAKAVENNF